jgi:hypothetical protein
MKIPTLQEEEINGILGSINARKGSTELKTYALGWMLFALGWSGRR